jgi:hypothetical protein
MPAEGSKLIGASLTSCKSGPNGLQPRFHQRPLVLTRVWDIGDERKRQVFEMHPDVSVAQEGTYLGTVMSAIRIPQVRQHLAQLRPMEEMLLRSGTVHHRS